MDHDHHHDIIRSNHPDLKKIESKIDRRQFLTKTSLGLGAVALSSLFGSEKALGNSLSTNPNPALSGGLGDLPHFLPSPR